MRWLVDVASLGKSDKESLLIEAESWQKALQTARAQRGESAPMSGFSIELLDDGCRAIDPMSRLRYDVKKAPEDSPGTRSVPPRPSTFPAAAAKKSQPAPPRPTAASAGPAAVEAAPTPAPASIARPVPPREPFMPVAPPASATPAKSDVAASVPSQILFKREQDASEAMPLTYREYVFLVAPGTTEAAAETFLLTQVERVRTSLERVAPGKLVNLGVFDVAFQGKPPLPPLATLVWKDWRGAPVVTFPRQVRSPPLSPPAPSPVAEPVPAVPPVPEPFVLTPSPLAAGPLPVTVLAPTPAPTPAPVVATPAPPVTEEPPSPAPVTEASPATDAIPAQTAALAPVSVPPPPAHASVPPPPAPPPTPRSRVRGEDLIADLFEAMHDLHFVHDALEGGEFCLALAMEKLPCQAGLVHLYDIDRREFLIASTRGAGASKLLLARHPENDAMLLGAMRKRRAIVVVDAAKSEAASLDRYNTLGGARSLLIAPVILSGRFLGAIELLNPLDGQPFNDSEGNALTYIAEQFAEFISSHGIVTDPERIRQRQLPEA